MRELPTPTLDFSPSVIPLLAIHPLNGERRSLHPSISSANDSDLGPLEAVWARNAEEVMAAQRLRHDVFAVELGAQLPFAIDGYDIDPLDEFCEHLTVRRQGSTQVLGTYRVLTPAQATRAGHTYTDQEFDLRDLDIDRSQALELGRCCVHAEYRNGPVMLLLWGALVEFMARNNLTLMLGCASIHLGDRSKEQSAQFAGHIWHGLTKEQVLPPPHPAKPLIPMPIPVPMSNALTASDTLVSPPALITAYLRLGAKVLGPPAWDSSFNTADLPMLMRVCDLPNRFKRMYDAAR